MIPAACDQILRALSEVPYLTRIKHQEDYEHALALVDEMIDDYETYEPLIELLARSIQHWEDEADEFAEFNASVAELDIGIAALGVLMDQYGLDVADQPELGSKEEVSELLNNAKGKKLNLNQIEALSHRFGVSPALFFD